MRSSTRLLRRCSHEAVYQRVLAQSKPTSLGLSTDALLAGTHSYLTRCIVRNQHFDNIASLLWERLEDPGFFGEPFERFMAFDQLQQLHDLLDQHFYRSYFELQSVHRPACLMLRLNGLVHNQFVLTLQQLFGDSLLREHLPAVLEARYVRSRALQLFTHNCTADSPKHRQSASGKRFEERLRLVQGSLD